MGEINCPRCGAVAPDAAERCGVCGAALWSETGAAAPKKGGRRWILWLVVLPIAGCSLFFAVVTGLTLLLPKLNEATKRARAVEKAQLTQRARLSTEDEAALAPHPSLLRVCKALEEYARWHDGRMPSALSELTTPDENGDVLLESPGDLLDEDGRPFVYSDPTGAGREAIVTQVGEDGGTIASATLRLPR